MTVADLDGNGKPELIAAVMSYQKNRFSENIPTSTQIFVFEKKNRHFRYIWKSGPLFYLTPGADATAERIRKILPSPDTDDLSVVLVGDRGNYRLEFADGYYLMNPSSDRIRLDSSEKDMLDYLPAPVDACFLFSGKRNDYFMTGKISNNRYRITLYRIGYVRDDPFVFYTRWNTSPLTSFSVIPGKKTYTYMEATTAGTIKIYSMKKI